MPVRKPESERYVKTIATRVRIETYKKFMKLSEQERRLVSQKLRMMIEDMLR